MLQRLYESVTVRRIALAFLGPFATLLAASDAPPTRAAIAAAAWAGFRAVVLLVPVARSHEREGHD